jgi:hypothetical protein
MAAASDPGQVDGCPDPLKHSARLCLDGAMCFWQTPLPDPNTIDTTCFFPAETRMISDEVAQEAWQTWMGRSRSTLTRILQCQYHLAGLGPDWMAGSLNQPFGRRRANRADAIAYDCFCSLIRNGEVFLATIPTRSWAHRDFQVCLNRGTLRNAGVKLRLPRWTSGYDGLIQPSIALPMSQVFLRESVTPQNLEPAFNTEDEELDWFPLENGHCSMAKCVAMLILHGRLARFPYQVNVPRIVNHSMSSSRYISPMVYFFALEPVKFREHLRYLHVGP